jgi:DNA-binding transcriptional MocR family regulator
LAARLEIAKQASDLCTSGLDQRIVYEAWKRGVLARQIPRLRAHYREKRDVMVHALRAEMGDALSWQDPRGGFFIWAALPSALDGDRLLQRAVQHGVIFVAGAAFYVNGSGRQMIRLSFSAPTHDRMREGVKRLAAALGEEMAEGREAASGRVFP